MVLSENSNKFHKFKQITKQKLKKKTRKREKTIMIF